MNSGIVSVAAITVVSYLVAQAVKATRLDRKWLPVICGACGGIMGILGLFAMPDFPAEDVLTALAVGIVSGLAATGSHEILKKLGVIKNEGN